MAVPKCHCGYELKFHGEQEMLDQWGCARTIVSKQGFGNSVRMCSIDERARQGQLNDEFQENPTATRDTYKEMVEQNKPKPATKPDEPEQTDTPDITKFRR